MPIRCPMKYLSTILRLYKKLYSDQYGYPPSDVCGSMYGAMVIITGNRLNEMSFDAGQVCLHFTVY